MRAYKKDTILLVDWVDITDDSGWHKESDIEDKEPDECRTLGFYLNHNGKVLRLSPSISDDERSIIVIPQGCIKKIRVLKEPK